EREPYRFERPGNVSTQAVLHHRRQRSRESERAQHRRRREEAQERPGIHGHVPGSDRANAPSGRQFMMFSANHLRHSAVFSARSLWSMMMAFSSHCSTEVNTPGSLATAGSSFASRTTGLPFLNLATSACTCGSSATLMNLYASSAFLEPFIMGTGSIPTPAPPFGITSSVGTPSPAI